MYTKIALPATMYVRMRARYIIAGIVLLGGMVWLGNSVFTTPKLHVRWVIAHEPVALFEGPAKVFEEEFNKNSDGTKMNITVLGPDDLDNPASSMEAWRLLNEKQIEFATVPVSALQVRYPPLSVTMLPRIFKNFSAAEGVLDGPVGQRLLDGLAASTTNRGLAFTLSGGFEVIQTLGVKINSMDDFAHTRIATLKGALGGKVLGSFGADPVVMEPEEGRVGLEKAVKDRSVDGGETTYTRLSVDEVLPPTVINETNHALFLTVLLVSNDFYASLSPQNQRALEIAARAAAKIERADSITLGEKTKADLAAKGVLINTMTPGISADFTLRAQRTYSNYESVLDPALIREVIAAQQ